MNFRENADLQNSTKSDSIRTESDSIRTEFDAPIFVDGGNDCISGWDYLNKSIDAVMLGNPCESMRNEPEQEETIARRTLAEIRDIERTWPLIRGAICFLFKRHPFVSIIPVGALGFCGWHY